MNIFNTYPKKYYPHKSYPKIPLHYTNNSVLMGKVWITIVITTRDVSIK